MNSLDLYTMFTNAQIAFGIATFALVLTLLLFRIRVTKQQPKSR